MKAPPRTRATAGPCKKPAALAGSRRRKDTTGDAARQFNVSAGRISQKRREYLESWQEFQGGDAGSDIATAVA